MATAVLNFSIVEVAKPNIGYSCPSSVRADVTVNLSTRREIREEWEGIRKHDVMFLVTVRAPNPIGTRLPVGEYLCLFVSTLRATESHTDKSEIQEVNPQKTVAPSPTASTAECIKAYKTGNGSLNL